MAPNHAIRVLNWFEVREHVLKFRQVGWRLVPTYRLEPFPQFEDRGVLVSPGDSFLRNPLEDLDDGSTLRAHHDRSTPGNEALGAQWGKMVANQLQQSSSQPGLGL